MTTKQQSSSNVRGQRLLKKKTPFPTRFPTPAPFPVVPFAVMGTTHTAIRGWIYQMEEDCLEAVKDWKNGTKLDQVRNTTETLLFLIDSHMKHEDEAFYIAVDNQFTCTAFNEGFREEHTDDETAQITLQGFLEIFEDPGLTLSMVHEVCAGTFDFASEHEAHLKHEENVLSPLTSQFPTGSSPAIVHHILMTNFGDVYESYFGLALTQLVKRESLTVVGTYVNSIKRALDNSQYDSVLPSIKEACGDLWSKVEKGLISGGYTTADEEKLPPGVFGTPAC